MLFRCGW